ncbi:hypothetical protein MFU01_74460 [Myxococcus fulvus]|uniref:Immunity protein 52 domain-containing protein n=2 Tax=Myxococcus fulvus TaxID=33 RepID=A0A511TE11_MYXFU|nr:DUF5953 family protein [Myxococcus fulvus]GEN12409.1 hypothetical protein MFU01_74460 [Myxococcus fulvus]
MTRRNALTFIVYAPALVGKDDRPVDILHGMEEALPALQLRWRLSDSGRPIPLPQRDAWLIDSIEGGEFPLVCNGDESHPVTVFGRERSGRFSPGGQPQFEVHAELPRDETVLAAAAAVLESVAEGAHAFWGHAARYGYGSEVAQQLRRSPQGPQCSPRGLPMLSMPEKLPAPEIPNFLAWLNYWSAATAQAIGFPDPARDADLLSRARRTASGGWVVRLTDSPLDLDQPDHLAALLRAYERFPEIGGRTTPRE